MRKLGLKFRLQNDQIINETTGKEIPEDEPVFLLRARDILAIHALCEYRKACIYFGCPPEHISGITEAIDSFNFFPGRFPPRMKAPGTLMAIKPKSSEPHSEITEAFVKEWKDSFCKRLKELGVPESDIEAIYQQKVKDPYCSLEDDPAMIAEDCVVALAELS